MTTDDTTTQEKLAEAQAKATGLQYLRTLTADRPKHRAYLDALIAAPTVDARARVDAPHGVSQRVEDALYADAAWCLAPLGPGRQPPYPNQYGRLREASAVSAARAAATRRANRDNGPAALSELLRLD